ncbi:MAG: hypothetical protein ABIH59_01570 [archaeon]
MYPHNHFFFGLIFSLVLFIIFPQIGLIESVIILLANFFVDVDHYLYYVYKKKDYNLKNAYNWFVKANKKILELPKEKRKHFYSCFCFLHGIEPILFLFVLGFFLNKYFFFLGIGISFHLICDIYYEQVLYKTRIHKLSIIYDYFRYNKLKFFDI